MKKALIATSVASMIDQFNMPNILLLSEMGYEVTVAANFDSSGSITEARAKDLIRRLECMGVKVVNVPIPRRIMAVGSIIKSYRILKKLSRKNGYDILHCHSPIGGAVARMAVRRERKRGMTKTVYTAHGFHFYRGAPKKSWLLYYPVEKFCSRFTDVLITINGEDYELAKRKMRCGRVEYVPGVGVDESELSARFTDAASKRKQFGIPGEAPVILSVGELNANKNHESALRAFADLGNTDAHYVIAGKGELFKKLVCLSRELGIEDRVHLLGYREDVKDIYRIADVFLHLSFREGLPVSVIEAMASGLPIVASRIRGNVDLVEDGGGILVSADDVDGAADAIERLLSSRKMRDEMSAYNKEAAKKYSVENVVGLLEKIYE